MGLFNSWIKFWIVQRWILKVTRANREWDKPFRRWRQQCCQQQRWFQFRQAPIVLWPDNKFKYRLATGNLTMQMVKYYKLKYYKL